MTAPWWLFTMCVQLEETDAGLAVGLSKTSWGNPPGGETERRIKIHASAQLTIKPNYLWIGLMGHMSKFPPDQEVTWEGASVYVCAYKGWSMCPWQKDKAERRRLGARSWLCAISSIKQIYLAFRQFDQNPEIPLQKISQRLFMAWQLR